jgi:hypothetical protein
VQNNDTAGRRLQIIRCKRKHPETARIRPEVCGFNHGAAGVWPEVSAEIRKAIDAIQLWQLSQKFDIFDEGHRQLLVESSSNLSKNR